MSRPLHLQLTGREHRPVLTVQKYLDQGLLSEQSRVGVAMRSPLRPEILKALRA